MKNLHTVQNGLFLLNNHPNAMIRVIHAPKERLTPFDLRTKTFRVNVELSTHYHKHTRKKIRAERLLSEIKKKIEFSGQDGYQTVPFGPLMSHKL